MTITLYGIKNCDTMKKARAWLDGHGVAYSFHDYKTLGIEEKAVDGVVPGAGLGDNPQSRGHDLS